MTVGAWASLLSCLIICKVKSGLDQPWDICINQLSLKEIFKMHLKSYTEEELLSHSPSQKWGILYSRHLLSSCIAFTWAVRNLCLNNNALLNVDHAMSILCFLSGINCQIRLRGSLKQELFPFLPLGKTDNAGFSSKVLLHENLVFMWKICL